VSDKIENKIKIKNMIENKIKIKVKKK